MKLGILGLAKSGKTTLFNSLTAAHQATDKFKESQATNVGRAEVKDERLIRLRDLFSPRRFVPATTQYVDIPGISSGDGPESLNLGELRSVDALVHVVRAFADPEILHPLSSIDPRRDAQVVDLELILSDHDVVLRRLERLNQAAKRGAQDEERREEQLLRERILPALERETPLRQLGLQGEDERRLRGFQLLSQKPMLLVINAGEDQLRQTTPELLGLERGVALEVLVASARIEDEIARLSPGEQVEFLRDLGLEQPSTVRVVQKSYELLGLISFFTVGEDEVRAWTVRRGTLARGAAAAIHSDIERGFIRAEVVDWEQLLALGSLQACRDRGVLRIEGKDYPVRDGEVVHFRFNV